MLLHFKKNDISATVDVFVNIVLSAKIDIQSSMAEWCNKLKNNKKGLVILITRPL
ncbi:hypothetical protein PTRA_a1963 [Pseudoalteromonas translucida KMM 520]|uniref:Uncharacterized protein n=1 Tax=Pseudoalteromonas translucida KMM 520 TaxID=1315283 RepID=A0A0U2WMF8_9GAMM|nr:hypothetical protein PTRA_a1963 [Pseudoalteromonas translucida KMM 520]